MSSTEAPLIPEQRQQRLVQRLRREGVLSIHELTHFLGVSHMTVRRDIAALEQAGLVTSVRNGVRLADTVNREPPNERRQRATLELPRKQAIARLAADLVADGMTVFLDAGSTCQAMVPFLAERTGLTVVTNDFLTVGALLDHPRVRGIHTGGHVDVASASSSGLLAAATLAELNLDLCFLSSGAWSIQRGLTSPGEDKVALKLAALRSATTSALVADSTKYGTVQMYRVVPLDRLDLIVTDDGISSDTREAVEELGVTLHLATL